MRISFNVLKSFIQLDDNIFTNTSLLEDIGLEVKKLEKTDDDYLLTLELLANRGDHHCYEGLAREISGRTGDNIITKPTLTIPSKQEEFFSVETNGCIAYSLTPFSVDKNGTLSDLDEYYLNMLECSGVNHICSAIDVTNVVNLELGQPAHVYDADKVKGKIVIRKSETGEIANLMFHDEGIQLPEGVTVIADDEKILAIAGIIGCKEASVTKDTKHILFETGLFDPVEIRKASKKLGIQTMASMRFERGGDVSAIQRAVNRAALLYDEVGWKNKDGSCMVQNISLPEKQIIIDSETVSDYLDCAISNEEISARLSRYGFQTKQEDGLLTVKVPSHRIWDVEYPVDLYEEIGKSIGYNNLPNIMPIAEKGADTTYQEEQKELVNNCLVNEGFFEVFTDSIYSNKHRDKMCLSPDDKLNQHVAITNAQDKGYSILKNNCLIQAVELIEKNIRVRNKDVKAFEWTRIFTPDKDSSNGVCEETKILWGVVNGNAYTENFSYKDIPSTPLYLKGLISKISLSLGVNFKFDSDIKTSEAPIANLLHPLRRMQIKDKDGNVIGIFGEIHPKVLFAMGIKNERPCYFQFESDKLLNLPQRQIQYQQPSELLPITRDICLDVPERFPAGEILEDIKGNNDHPISDARITDVYQANDEEDRKITYSIDYQADKKAFVAEEVNEWTSTLKEMMEKKIRSSR